MKRVILALAALIGTGAPSSAQSPAPQPTPWGNFDWSQVAAPRVTLPQSVVPLQPTIPGSVAAPPAAPSPARTPVVRAPAVQAPPVQPPASRQAARPGASQSTTQSARTAAPTTPRRARTVAAAPVEDKDPPQPVPAAPVEPPLAILLDGLGIYVQQDYVGVSALARPLQQQGYRTIVDNHFMRNVQGQVPAIIIGHSMGGQSALRLARQIVQAGYPAPDVITIDAAPLPSPCAVPRCTNIFSPGFPQVVGAQNISAWDHGAYLVSHAMLASNPAIQRMVLQYTASLIAQRNGARVAAQRSSND
ncbi:hypothetical protein G3545_03195 [Starkeya sp. ORNL1]|uniref:hypothetical protein n=1 Tax=Starkeya sp. ORNL1 TaxID=2709380 RepID=UPI0014635D5F|nr:hypothetical protein [Starkeya sp. ORNL1]QJP12754.1 hypothetical protein G3545_03195 [Starkeya sp. ORNL1]